MATVEFANAPAVLLANAHPTADIVSRNVDRALAVLAAEQVGSCERILEITTDYAKTREQFGRPIGSFQAIKHICSNMLANLEFARSAAQAALAADDDAGLSTDERHWRASMAKAVCSETLRDAAHSAVQVHGGIGFSWEGPAHLYLRRARTDEVIFGNPGAHWDRLAGAAVQLPPPRRHLSVEADEARAARTVPVDPSDVEDVEAFRTNVRAFLEDAPKPPGLRNYGPTPTAIDVEPGRAWHKYLAVYGYACLDWPREHCGANASVIVQGIFAEECARLGMPRQLGFTAIELAGPILIKFGSDAQKERYLDPIRLGDHIWTQLFSEPGAGSDLASVRTKAERTENGWRVNGQKVWSSAADCAKYGLLLARTGTDGHRGLSMFIVPMQAAGVTVRPIKQIDGESKINEVFLENVTLSADALIGEVGQGWAVAMATLGRERITLGAQAVAMFKLHERMVEAASDRGLLDQSLTRTLTRLWARIWLLRFTWHRAVNDADMASSAFTSLKLMTSETSRDLGDVATEVLGTDACIDPAGNELIHAMFVGRAQTILGGTSEIQRNILAERVLGLPK
jgi:alkylation response protein AidB-like acyl-CoA dehydrogenase